MRAWQGPALLSYGCRPFFLLGAIRAALAMALWAGLHLLANGDLVHLLLFGSLGAFALAGRPLIDRRKRREMGTQAWRQLLDETKGATLLQPKQQPPECPVKWGKISEHVDLPELRDNLLGRVLLIRPSFIRHLVRKFSSVRPFFRLQPKVIVRQRHNAARWAYGDP